MLKKDWNFWKAIISKISWLWINLEINAGSWKIKAKVWRIRYLKLTSFKWFKEEICWSFKR